MIVFCNILFAAAQTVTAGWENVCAERREYPATKVIWRAPADDPKAFSWEFESGAEGTVTIEDGALRVVKTNARGFIVVRAKPFAVRPGQGVRFSADLVSTNADVNYSSSALRAHGRTSRSLAIDSKAERLNFWSGGMQTMRSIPCTAPGMSFRKYGQCFAADDLLTPAIVISGAPSESVWRNWMAEDLAAADKAWPPREPNPDYLPLAMENGAFDALLAKDCVHTAEVRRVNGYSRLLVDGEIAAPVIYKVKTDLYLTEPDLRLRNESNFGGRRLDGGPVRLVSQNIDLRDYYQDGRFCGVAMANDIRNAMRLSPRSLMVVCTRVNAPRSFATEHPDEVWINEAGEPVLGETVTCSSSYGTTAERFGKKAYPWPSASSRVWRDWVSDGLRELVRELRRQGLDKRVVGIHLSGYHDDQMTQLYTDYSRPAREEYAQMLAEGGLSSTNYAYCLRLAANRALNEFARTFKRELGKPAVAIRWCESPFTAHRAASTDVAAFTRCDALDVIVCQPDYRERLPGFPSVSRLPMESLHLHGKLFLNEYDIRTWVRPYSNRTAPSTKSIGMAADLPMWRTMVRKLAGEADATRMGYWFYDMKGGWYDDEGLAADISGLAGEARRLARQTPSTWSPDVAVVIDESQMLAGDRPLNSISFLDSYIYADQCRLLGSSGVPYVSYLAEDALERPELLTGRKLVVLAFFRTLDARRADLIRTLAAKGVSLVFLSETGLDGDASALGFRPRRLPGAHSRKVVPVGGFDENVTGFADVVQMREQAENDHLWGARCTVAEEEGVRVLARYADDGLPALAERIGGPVRRTYVCEPSGLTPGLFNRLAREAGAYVPVGGGVLQVNMNGDFLSVHCLRPGTYDFRLPFDCRVVNLCTNREEPVADRMLELRLTAGETCRFRLLSSPAPAAHPRLTIVRLQDAPDRHNELVFETEYLLAANELPFDVTAPAVFWEDSLTGEGTANFRQAPLPHARTAKTPDFHINPTGGVTVLESPYPCVAVGYSGGAVGRGRAMTDLQRALRPYVSGRDGVFLSNTWGDGNRDSRINEKFLLREIDAGAELGVDVIQIDDGWQAGRSANSAAIAKRGDGRWGRFWDDPHFWDVDSVRFPNGLEPLIGSARAKGMQFGLWFGPDSSNDAECWEKDAAFLLSLHRTLGISYFKLDSMRTETPLALERQTKLMRRLIADSGAKITVDLDVTAGVRPGYYGFPEIGPVFVENRYIAKGDCRLWWPHLTLRNFWSLAHYVDPARLQMEVLNPERMPELYAPDDPLAPVKWPRDTIIAISMFASPLGWFEIQNPSVATGVGVGCVRMRSMRVSV